MDVCDLGKTEVILGMPWLQVHNPEINWEKREVKMTRCLPICGRYVGKKEMGPEIRKRRKGKKKVQADKIERIRWAADKKEDWGREEEMKLDHRKVEVMVPQKCVWKDRVGENADKEDMGSCHKSQGGV